MKKFAVIGNPVQHSLSPLIHQMFAQQKNLSIEFLRLEPKIETLAFAISDFKNKGGSGLNVTLPFKTQLYDMSDELSDAAQQAGAVSCIAFAKDGKVFGDNFDGIGLVNDLTDNFCFDISEKTVLILGAGGAVRGIIGPLLACSPREVIIANRTKRKAVALANFFTETHSVCGISLNEIPDKIFDLVIHSTSLGYLGRLPDIPHKIIGRSTLCYDLSYGAAAQPFLNYARNQQSKQISDGLGMLVEHNVAAFNLWHKIYPDSKQVIRQLRKKFPNPAL